MTDSEQNNKPISEPLKTPREKNSTPSSDNPSLVRYRNLEYNILKSLDDKAVRDIDFPELEPCSECNNDILTFPLREFTRLRCGHVFHRLCAEKKLMLNVPNPCPFPDCGKNVEITEIFSTTVNYPIGRLPESNVIIQDSPLSQSSGTSALTNTMSERFILTSPPMRMEGNIGIQQMGSQLRCVKCSEDLSSCLPPLGFLRTFPHPPPKPLTFPDMNIDSVNFRELNDRIIKAEDDNKRTALELIHSYYYFGKGYRLWFDHYKKTYSDDTSNSLVNDKIREYFPDQDKTSEANLRKRKEKAIKIFKLFDGVGGVDKINCIKSFPASTISRLGVKDIDYVIAKVLKAGQ
ncbi:hypothetical protein C1646_753311 [Rhizophagus diaphanus]|nr:hypothetical protein C1646_753311 [Rhizophagus diaphanus] [Rhizophagus sp. MUCL 43196]